MVNWKEIHQDFTEELQKKWEEDGFDYESAKWLISLGFRPQEVDLVNYWKKIQEYEQEYEFDEEKFKKCIKTVKIEYTKWKELGFVFPQDSFFCVWLRNRKQLAPEQVLGNEQQLRGEYNKGQVWLDKNYPDKDVKRIYINRQLEGELDCSGYYDLREVSISHQVDASKFEIKKGFYRDGTKIKKTYIIHSLNAQAWLEENYPQEGVCQRKDYYGKEDFGKTREQITELHIVKNLEGSLDLSDFVNLTSLDCQVNNLTELDLTGLTKLKKIWCGNNYLTNIIYPDQAEQLTELYINNNNLPTQDLSVFSRFSNLESLRIDNDDKNKIKQNIYNHFTGSLEPLKNLSRLQKLYIANTNIGGSLEPLKNLTKLKWLFISNIDIDSGVEYLPDSLEYIEYETEARPNCKLVAIKNQLDQITWQDIHKDFQPEYKKDWLEQDFNKEQTKEWIKLGVKPGGYNENIAKFITWLTKFRKLDLNWALENEEEFADLRDKYKNFGTCEECQQPNSGSGSGWQTGWCQSCNAKHFQEEFNNWTSGNPNIDNFIQKCQQEATSPWNVLEWIPYEKFENIKHIADGGFGKVYKAEWIGGSINKWNNKDKNWERNKRDRFVALKTLSNSQNIKEDFLTELTLYKMFKSEVSNMVPCYGISKDKEGDYIMVMKFMKEGSLKEYLKKNYRELNFYSWSGKNHKLNLLRQITQGLKDIHRKKLIHRDFHSGNIIIEDEHNNSNAECRITDLGLCKPSDEIDDSKVFGVLPYVAPEVLQGKTYTQASDVYSLGMIMYEILTGWPPFCNESHDADLALRICQGIRPKFPNQVKYPQILVNLIKQCWDSEPNKRPIMKEISKIMGDWFDEYGYLKHDTSLCQQVEEAEEYNKTLPEEVRYPTYQDNNIWHSKPINTKQITKKLAEYQASKNLELNLDDINFDELNVQNIQDDQELQSHQEIPPK